MSTATPSEVVDVTPPTPGPAATDDSGILIEQNPRDTGGRMAGYARSLGQLFVAKKAALTQIKSAVASKVRYVAYSSDVGEAFRPVVSDKVVKATYGLAFLYVGCDVGHHAYMAHKEGESPLRAGSHAFIFQGLASLALPMVIIHTAVHKCQHFVAKNPNPRIKMWAPTVLGLSILPFLPIACDEPVEYLVDLAFDTALGPLKNGHAHGHTHGEDADKSMVIEAAKDIVEIAEEVEKEIEREIEAVIHIVAPVAEGSVEEEKELSDKY